MPTDDDCKTERVTVYLKADLSPCSTSGREIEIDVIVPAHLPHRESIVAREEWAFAKVKRALERLVNEEE